MLRATWASSATSEWHCLLHVAGGRNVSRCLRFVTRRLRGWCSSVVNNVLSSVFFTSGGRNSQASAFWEGEQRTAHYARCAGGHSVSCGLRLMYMFEVVSTSGFFPFAGDPRGESTPHSDLFQGDTLLCPPCRLEPSICGDLVTGLCVVFVQ